MSKPVKWSAWANRDLERIAFYWTMHNRSDSYSKRLIDEANSAAGFIGAQPYIGKLTSHEGVRIKIVAGHFLVIYSIRPHHILILRFWDTRQNPRKLKKYLD